MLGNKATRRPKTRIRKIESKRICGAGRPALCRRLLVDKILKALLEEATALNERRVEQVVGFCGKGTLSDDSVCSKSFREFLKNVPSRILRKYASECLEGAPRTANTGLILQ